MPHRISGLCGRAGSGTPVKGRSAHANRLAGHGAVDAVLVTLVPTAVAAATGDDLVRALPLTQSRLRSTGGTPTPGPLPRPVIAVLPAQAARVELLQARNDGTVPAYADAQDAARALAHAAARARWLGRPQGAVPDLTEVETPRARDLVASFLDDNPEGGRPDPRRGTGSAAGPRRGGADRYVPQVVRPTTAPRGRRV